MKCTRCKKQPAIFFRPYSGESLCQHCLITSIEGQVRRIISKYAMFKPNDRIAVAVSGGKDSVALLHILTKIEKQFPAAEVVAITIDEGIRGYRKEAIRIARENCRVLGVEHFIYSFKDLYGHTLDEIVKITREEEIGPCSYCGILRRRALNIASREVEADKLATAHNLDDEAQTILLNIIHGDVARIARIEPVLYGENSLKFVPRVKPICEIPENEIALYAYLRGIGFQSVPCPYIGTALRHEIRHMLNKLENRHPGVKFTIIRAAEKIRPVLKKALAPVKLQGCRVCGEPTTGSICKPCEVIRKLGILKS
ncbi:TIGR00269 family protein [Candidatus Bathyarchaeota archaeon]|nr:TIGR00269 family protein [Candidatus Bathyarchaeota archaeon]